MLDAIEAALRPDRRDELEAAAARARSVPLSTPIDMAEATLACYARALAATGERPPLRPLSRERVRAALDYRPWVPPAAAVSTEPVAPPVDASAPAHRSLLSHLAHAALALRKTGLGRVLHRVTPAPVLNVLKSHLD
jgi:hypothetical protein